MRKCVALFKGTFTGHLCHILKLQEPQEKISQCEAVAQSLENAIKRESMFIGYRQSQWYKL